MSAHPTLLHRWFDEVWHNGNEKAINELLHEDAVIHGLGTDANQKGPTAFKPFYQNFRKEFPSVHVDLNHIIKTDDCEAAYCNVSSKNANGKTVQFTGITIAKFKDGLMIEGWNAFDFLTMHQQLGYKLVAEEESVVQ